MLVRILQFTSITLLLLTSVLIHPLRAQSNATTQIQIPDGFKFDLPGDWRSENTELGQLYISDSNTLRVLGPQILATLVGITDGDSLQAVLLRSHETLYAWQPEVSTIELVQISGKPAAFLRRPEGDVSVLFAAVEIEAGQHIVFDLTHSPEEDDVFPTLLFAVATLQHDITIVSTTATQVAAPTAIATFPATSEEEVTEEPFLACTITTTAPKTATLRVGPGTNRSPIAFLPVETEFHPLGRYVVESDSSVWYKLVKEEAAPEKAANEIWVAAADVVLTGDCDSTPEVEPRSIRIVGVGMPPFLIQPGLWRFAYEPLTNASCLNLPNVVIQTLQTLDFKGTTPTLNPVARFRLSDSGSSLTVTNTATGDIFDYSYIQKDSLYYSETYFDGYSNHHRIFLLSATQVRGETIINFDLEGQKCSGTIFFTAQYVGN